MDFIDDLSQEILKRVAPRIADAVLQELTAAIKQEAVFRYTEEEAAEKLGVSLKTIRQLRKDKQIEFTYSMLPTMGTDGKLHNGRISYLPEHLTAYLKRNEQKHFFGNLRAA